MTRMPPQAYTKEVLATAFDWLSRQPENIKKSIRTSDDLVGLYLRSVRSKEGVAPSQKSNEDLSSAKSFRSELQGLALNLKQFEDKNAEQETKEVSAPVSEYLHELNLMMSAQPAKTQERNQEQPQFAYKQNLASDESTALPSSASRDTIIPESIDTVLVKLDKKTLAAIGLAKERLNLSSNSEAIRVLVSLGEKHLKKIFGTEE
jgi:hypothetical protein